ncbi:MAG TPA: universal stress protein [Solirubrobacter sp.]
MTRLLIGYDASDSARAAIAAAAALFPGAEAVVATVQPPPPTVEAGAMARIALPDSVIREGMERLRAENERQGRETVAEAAAIYADASGSAAATVVLPALSVWRALRDEARRREADVLICGTRGEGRLDRFVLGSTASSLVHHVELPLLIVPAGASNLDGPVLAGFDESDGAREALRFAAAHLPQRRVTVAHAWRSPVRHSMRGQVLAHSGFDLFEEYAAAVDQVWAEVAEETADDGAAYARTLGLEADAVAPESGHGAAQALLKGARVANAAVLLVGSRGRGAVASTVLGSVASGLVHAAALPVLVVPDVNA